MNPKTTFVSVLLTLVSAVTATAQPEIVGIGAALIAGEPTKGPRIHKIVPDSPAAKAKLSEGLIISKVNGTPTAGKRLDDCVSMIRGAVGTTVELEMTDPIDGRTTQITLTREKVGVPTQLVMPSVNQKPTLNLGKPPQNGNSQ